MNTLRAILVEDEPSGMENLQWKLKTYCPEIEVVASCTSGEEAIKSVRRHAPDLLFLDIRLGDMTGFDVLKAIRHLSFEVIFTTSYDEYAIEAIKSSALDYLLKPLDVDELIAAVGKAREKFLQQAQVQNRLATQPGQPTKMAFPISTGKLFLDVKDIIYAEANDNIALLHMPEKKQVKLTKPLSWVENQLEDFGFCRIHNSYLINFNQMTEFIRNDGGYVIMSDGKAISVSRRRKDEFLAKMEKWNAG